MTGCMAWGSHASNRVPAGYDPPPGTHLPPEMQVQMMRKARLSSIRPLASLVAVFALPAVLLCATDGRAEAPAAPAAPAPAAAKGPTAEEIGKRVQAFYDSTKTF